MTTRIGEGMISETGRFEFKTRTRAELLDFLCLVFSIRVTADAKLETAEDIASATGVSVHPVRVLIERRVIHPRGSSRQAGFSVDDARLAAIVTKALDLGCGHDDLANLVDTRSDRCAECTVGECAAGCEVIHGLRRSFLRLERRAFLSPIPHERRRRRKLRHVIDSIEALIDLL